jgi:serine/threonine protein kinase/TolB-like protein/Tfp pilus assembly protein PilF
VLGRTLGHYRILHQLGAGSGGEVYVAEDLKLARKVAVKLIPPQLAAEPESLERFEREARVLAALNHPSIVTIYSVEEVDGIRFLAMELVEGKTLSALIPPAGLSFPEFMEIAVPLVEALSGAHEHGITHRDLKPANIMVSDQGRVKILDFGLAKLRREESGLGGSSGFEKSITQQGMLLGTLQYMSPEQVEGKEVDPRSDLFSVGIILHEMITGQRPFRGETGPSLISSIFRDDPPSVLDSRPDLPGELEPIIFRCLEKNPDDRYQTARELLHDLEGLAGLRAQTPLRTPGPASVRGVGPASVRMPGPASSRTGTGRFSGLEPLSGEDGFPPPVSPWRRWRFAFVAAGVLVLGIGASVPLSHLYRSRFPAEVRIVVLPFENLGAAEDAYFAAGITEEITSRLSAVQGLGVISRTSALQYDRTGKSVRQVGRDLGVNYVLEGSVRWDHAPDGSSRVRVTPQLIRVADDTNLWSERYERDAQTIFDVQTEIAEQVVQKLNVTLREPERRQLEAKSTENLDAHLAYLRGMAYGRGPTDKDAYLAVQMLEQAVTMDPGFVDAYYRLSRSQVYLYDSGIDRTPERLAKAKAAADRTLELAPDRPEGHWALGNYYARGLGDYDRALEEYAIVLKKTPNDSNALYNLGYIQLEKGMWEEGAASMEKALSLDPQNGDVAQILGEVYERLRRYREAEGAFNRAISIAPDDLMAYWRKADLYWLWDGTPERARAILESMPKQSDSESTRNWFLQEYYERKWQSALDRVTSAPWDWYGSVPRSYFEYLCYYRLSKPVKARSACETAVAALEKAVSERGEVPELHSYLGLAYAGLGRKADALREAERAVSLAPVSRDPYEAPYHVIALAKTYAQVGELDQAMNQIEYLLSIPSCFSVGLLRLDPDWDRLRGYPRFEKLLSSS